MNISIADFTPQEDVLLGSCSCGHWNNPHCNHHHAAQEVAGHQNGLIIIFMLILYEIST
jgi:hypothetical protein